MRFIVISPFESISILDKNRRWLIPGWILSALALFATWATYGLIAVAAMLFLSIWLTLWTVVCSWLGVAVVNSWRSLLQFRESKRQKFATLPNTLLFTAFATPFLLLRSL